MLFSVLISVYQKENPEFLEFSLASVLNQTILPSEIVLVKDGPLTTNLEDVIEKYILHHPELFKIVKLSTNKGLGMALNEGMTFAYPIVLNSKSITSRITQMFVWLEDL